MGGSACVLMSNRLISSRWRWVSLGRSCRGCSQTGSTTNHPITAMTTSIALVTCMFWPCWDTTRSRVVLASYPPTTTVVVAGHIGPGDHVLGACCHRAVGAPTWGCHMALCCWSQVRIGAAPGCPPPQVVGTVQHALRGVEVPKVVVSQHSGCGEDYPGHVDQDCCAILCVVHPKLRGRLHGWARLGRTSLGGGSGREQ